MLEKLLKKAKIIPDINAVVCSKFIKYNRGQGSHKCTRSELISGPQLQRPSS